jgi:hypothetical protein
VEVVSEPGYLTAFTVRLPVPVLSTVTVV